MKGREKVPGVQQVRTEGDGMVYGDGRQMMKQRGEGMEGGWACYHGDGFLEHLSFSASAFMASTVNASSESTVPTTPLGSCCHAIGPGEKA